MHNDFFYSPLCNILHFSRLNSIMYNGFMDRNLETGAKAKPRRKQLEEEREKKIIFFFSP